MRGGAGRLDPDDDLCRVEVPLQHRVVIAARDAALRPAPTLSSRSRITASAAARALPYRSGRSAGQNSGAGAGIAAAITSAPAGTHQRGPDDDCHDRAVLIAGHVLERDDPWPGRLVDSRFSVPTLSP
jgi:hypothetical protein